MRNAIRFLQRVFSSDKLRGITAAIDTALNGRSLDVDTAVVSLTTGPENYGFWSHEPYPFFTRDVKRFMVPGQTAFGSWDRSDALALDRGGSQYLIMYPDAVTRVGKLDYDVSCTTTLGKLTQVGHKGGIYDAGTQTTAGALMREICGYVNGQPTIGVTLYVASEFENIVLYGWLPYLSPTGENGAATGSARDNFLQVLFAINACLRDDENGVLRVENLPTEAQSSITADRMYRNNARVVTKQPVTSVTLLEHNYIVGSDTKTLFDGTALAGQTIVFSGPMSGLSWHTTAEPPVEMTILEQGANYAVLSAGVGVLTGTPYVDTTREIVRTVSNSDIPNTERIEQATLISFENSGTVADKLADYYAHRDWIECNAQIEFEDAGDVVNIWDPFDAIMRSACIERISPLVVSNVMNGRISALIGYTPWQTAEFRSVHDLFVNSGTWTVPAGVTTIRVVLIGGGSGGTKGGNGMQGNVGTPSGSGYSVSYSAGKGGNGGKGGEGGSPGRVLLVDIAVTPGQIFEYACGARGTGGVNPTAGQDTKWRTQRSNPNASDWDYSTASGEVYPNGYEDPSTGNRYAIPGKNGVDGGKGGDGGMASSSAANEGNPGDNAGGYQGGAGGAGSMADQHDWGPPAQFVEAYGGAGGGGASADANGGNATNATHSQEYRGDGSGYAGDGADAVTQSWSNTNYGCGGNGGNGGGGGGGAGGYFWNPYTSHVSASFIPRPGAAGAGGAGANGVKGCIIITYREPVT